MSSIEKKKNGKWVAEIQINGAVKTSPPLKTKREGLEWIEDQQVAVELGDSGTRLMSAAIIKGLIEKKDGTAYFGSTLIYTHHFANAIKFGYVTADKKVTKRGKEWYDRCLKQLSPRRQVYWATEGGVGYADPCIE